MVCARKNPTMWICLLMLNARKFSCTKISTFTVGIFNMWHGRVPTAQGKQGKWPKKTQGIWKFCQNTGKTQGIWFAQVVNSLTLKVKDISIFTAKISKFFSRRISLPSQFCVWNSSKSCKLAEAKFVFAERKHREFENLVWVGTLHGNPTIPSPSLRVL